MYKVKAIISGIFFVIAILSTVVFSALTVVSVLKIIDAEKNHIGAAIIFLGLAVTALFLVRYFKNMRMHYLTEHVDNTILQIAIESGGMITTTELAAKTNFGINEAMEYLDRNYASGFCEKKYTDDLIPVYHFTRVPSHDEKSQSVDIREMS